MRVTARLDLAPRLHRDAVIRAIEAMTERAVTGAALPWTIGLLALVMNQREYRVRAAVGWLIHQGRVARAGCVEQTNWATGRKYVVSLYRLVDAPKAANWSDLYAAFASTID